MRRGLALILPVWRAILPVVVLGIAGASLDRLLDLGLGVGVGRWPRWVTCGLVASFAVAVHPGAFLLLLAIAFAVRRSRVRTCTRASAAPSLQPTSARRGLVAVAGALALIVVARPAVPLYWDSFVWLGKARIASRALGALRSSALDPAAHVIPHGYPLLWPLAASWLSMFGRTAAALTMGAAAATILTLLLFLDAAADVFDTPAHPAVRQSWALWAGLALLGVTPLLFVHIRSAYVDLPVGLLAATCTLRLARAIESPGDVGDLSGAAIAAVALAGLKDEGIAHVAAIVFAVAVVQRLAVKSWRLLSPLTVLGSAAIPFVAWRALLASRGIVDLDHRLSTPAFSAAGRIGQTFFSAATDTMSWGALWPIAIGCAVLVALRPGMFRPATHVAALALLGEAALLAASLFFGPDRVRIFAFEGTLVNRLLVQLAPPAAAMFMLALGDAAGRERSWQGAALPKGED